MKRCVYALTAIMLTAVSASATEITIASDPALSGATLIDFNSEPSASFKSKTFSGVTFTATDASLLSIAPYTSGGIYGGSGQDLETDVLSTSFRIDFANAVSAFGTVWGGANNDWTVRVYNSSNTLLETLTFLGNNVNQNNYTDFYGVKNTDIKSVTFDIVPAQYATDWVKLDNFQFVTAAAAVPDSGNTLLLLSGSLTAIAAWRRRR